MNTKGWHIPFRTHLELRAFKTRLCQRWFDDDRVGIFPEIVQEVSRETGISEQDAKEDVIRILKRNSTQSIMKPRHVEIAKELLANGFSAGNVAEILSKVEGFPIGIDVINDNPTIVAWRQTAPNENPQTQAHSRKSAEVTRSEIQLYIPDNAGGRRQYARVPIQAGGIEYMVGEKPTLDTGQRERLVGALYTTGLGPQQISSVLSEVTGTPYPAYTVTNILQKLRRAGDNPLEMHKPGAHPRTENQQRRTRVAKNRVTIYTKKGGTEGAEETIATVDVSDAKITWQRDPATEHSPDREILDRIVAGLYSCGVPPKRIPEIITEAYAITLTPKQVIKAIERGQQRGVLQRQKAGHFHSKDARRIEVRVDGEKIEVHRNVTEQDGEAGKSEQPTPTTHIATIKIRDGTIDPELRQNSKSLEEAIDQGTRDREKSIETYVRFRWHTDPRVGIASDLGQELGISSTEVKRIVTRQNAWGILKPAHVYLIRELANAGVPPIEIKRTIEKLEDISISGTPIRTKLKRLGEDKMLGGIETNPHLVTDVTREIIQIRLGERGAIKKSIKIADAVAAAEAGFNGLYAYPPPTAAQYEVVNQRARETHDSFEQILQEGGWVDDTLEALLLHGVYGGDQTAYDDRFRTTLDPTTIYKIVTYAKHSDLTLADIAKKCGCGTSTAKKYALRCAYFENEELYNRRFNPPPLTPEQDQKANRLARENRMLAPGERESFTAIVNEVGGSFEAVRTAILKGTYGNDELAFAKDYPAGRHDLPPQLIQDIIRGITTTTDSAYAIGQRLGANDASVSRVALVAVYAHDYERYAARFPEKRVDEAAMAAATEHIRDPNSPHRTYKAIAQAVSAEVAHVSAASVMILARHLLTKAEREKRFAGDPDYRIGQVTHVVAEGICKRAAANTGIAGYSETRLHRHHRKHDGPVPTGRQRRWVKVDLILRLKDGQAGELLGRAGADGVPLGDEAGLSPEIIAATREIVFEFGADQTPASVQRKDGKYAADRHGHPRKGRLVLHVATADWWGEGRVQADPGHLANARVANLGFVADLLQMAQHEREALAEMARNNRARDQAAQERLAEKEKLSYCDDTARYYADKGIPVPDWRGPQQTLDAPIEAAQEAQNTAAGKGIDPARWAEAREFARALQAAQDADAARDKEKEKKGIDAARLAEAREYANVLQAARDADAARDKEKEAKGSDTERWAEARKFAQALREARNAQDTQEREPDQAREGLL